MSTARSLTALALLAALLTGAGGCVFHHDRNAPGVIDVHKPPAPRGKLKQPAHEEPGDPGEETILLLPGVYGGGGPHFTGSSSSGFGAFGVEATVLYGQRAHSHQKPTLFPWLPVLTEHAFGGSLGMTLYQGIDDTIGPLYVEAQYSYLGVFTASAGYAVRPQDGQHGPQFSISALGFYVRSTTIFGRGTQLLFGGVLKFPLSFVWSR